MGMQMGVIGNNGRRPAGRIISPQPFEMD